MWCWWSAGKAGRWACCGWHCSIRASRYAYTIARKEQEHVLGRRLLPSRASNEYVLGRRLLLSVPSLYSSPSCHAAASRLRRACGLTYDMAGVQAIECTGTHRLWPVAGAVGGGLDDAAQGESRERPGSSACLSQEGEEAKRLVEVRWNGSVFVSYFNR